MATALLALALVLSAALPAGAVPIVPVEPADPVEPITIDVSTGSSIVWGTDLGASGQSGAVSTAAGENVVAAGTIQLIIPNARVLGDDTNAGLHLESINTAGNDAQYQIINAGTIRGVSGASAITSATDCTLRNTSGTALVIENQAGGVIDGDGGDGILVGQNASSTPESRMAITNLGTIKALSNDRSAIVARAGTALTLISSGSISSGNDVVLINSDNAQVEISGSITGLNDGAAIWATAGDNHTVSLSAGGTINMQADESYGIVLGDDSDLDVAGTITMEGADSRTIELGTDSSLDLSGTVSLEDSNSRAIFAARRSDLTISGLIEDASGSGVGAWIRSYSTLDFSGEMRGVEQGIVVDGGGSTLVLSGDMLLGSQDMIVATGGGIDPVGVVGIALGEDGSVVHLSGTIDTPDPTTDTAISTYASTTTHILTGASVGGGIHHMGGYGGTAYLTFGLAKDGNNMADLTAADSAFDIDMAGSISPIDIAAHVLPEADAMAIRASFAPDPAVITAYFAGGTTTLSGGASFEDMFIGGDCFDGQSVPDGHDGDGHMASADLSRINGATASVIAASDVETTGLLTLGSGSSYRVQATNTHTAADADISGQLVLDVTDAGAGKLDASGDVTFRDGAGVTVVATGGATDRQDTVIEVAGDLLGLTTNEVTIDDQSAIYNYEATLVSGAGGSLVVSTVGAASFENIADAHRRSNTPVGRVLDTLEPGHGAGQADLFNALGSLGTDAQVSRAMSQLQADSAAAASGNLAGAISQQSNAAMRNQFTAFRMGSLAAASGSTITATAQNATEEMATPEQLAFAFASYEEEEEEDSNAQRVEFTEPLWTAFGRVYGGFGQQQTKGDTTGYSFNYAGGIAGVDYRFNSNLRAGAYFGYAYGGSDVNDDLGTSMDNAFRVGPYLSWNKGGLFIDSAPSVGVHFIDTTRNVQFMGATAEASRVGWDFSWLNTIGYDFNLKNGVTLTPTYDLDFSVLHDPAYQESGAGGANLKVDGRTDVSLSHSLKLKVGKVWQLNEDISLLPEVWGGWKYGHLNGRSDVTSAFAVTPGESWSTELAGREKHRAVFGAAITALVRDTTSVYARYDQTLWESGYDTSFTAGVIIRF